MDLRDITGKIRENEAAARAMVNLNRAFETEFAHDPKDTPELWAVAQVQFQEMLQEVIDNPCCGDRSAEHTLAVMGPYLVGRGFLAGRSSQFIDLSVVNPSIDVVFAKAISDADWVETRDSAEKKAEEYMNARQSEQEVMELVQQEIAALIPDILKKHGLDPERAEVALVPASREQVNALREGRFMREGDMTNDGMPGQYL